LVEYDSAPTERGRYESGGQIMVGDLLNLEGVLSRGYPGHERAEAGRLSSLVQHDHYLIHVPSDFLPSAIVDVVSSQFL
jgi:hypothetical protein